MSTAPTRRVTAEEYLAFEREAEARHEFVDGQIVAMSGGTERHAILCDNLISIAKVSTVHSSISALSMTLFSFAPVSISARARPRRKSDGPGANAKSST